MKLNNAVSIGGICLVFLSGLLLLRIASQSIRPIILPGTFQEKGEEKSELLIPLRLLGSRDEITYSFGLRLPDRFPTHYHFQTIGCIKHFAVNGHSLQSYASVCDDELGISINLSEYLRVGENSVTLTVINANTYVTVHALNVRPSRMDPVILFPLVLLLLLTTAFLASLYTVVRPARIPPSLFLIFIGGILLRLIYASATHFANRTYDWQGHVEYILYLRRFGTIPPVSHGWETYQPPLYYHISALFTDLSDLTLSPHVLIESFEDLQILSVILSIATLLSLLWIGLMVFPHKSDRPSLLLFASLAATFPSLLFLSSRINNDTLLTLFSFLTCGVLISWWQSPSSKKWIWICLLIPLAILTKSNGLVLIPLALILLTFKQKIRPRDIITHAGILLSSVAIFTGWLFYLRVFREGQTGLVGNIQGIHPLASIDMSHIQNFLTFNPLTLLTHPIVSYLPPERTLHSFWDVLFRTAFIGNFSFGALNPFVILLLLSALTLLPLTFIGVIRNIKAPSDFPHWIVGVILLASHIFFVISSPYLSSEDFRYSLLLIIPLAYLTISGWSMLTQTARDIGLALIILFLVHSTLFPLLLFLQA